MKNPRRYILFGVLAGITMIILFATHLNRPYAVVEANVNSETITQENQNIVESKSNEEFLCMIPKAYPESILNWCEIIQINAEYYGIDQKLIAAVILQESGGQADAFSSSGAVGLMQVMPSDGIAANFQCINGPCFSNRPTTNELLDPTFNINYGTKMLFNLFETHGNWRDALKYYGPMDVGYYYADIIMDIYQNYQ